MYETTTNFSLVTLPNEYNDDVEKGLISDSFREILEQVIIFIMLPLNIIGFITNIINIRVFVEQGLQNDSTAIGLLSLSVSDLFGCLTMIPYSLCFLIKYIKDLPTQYICMAYATILCYPHIIFSHTSAWVTVYISIERSLCVIIPLRVKLLFKPKTTIIAVIVIFLFFWANQMPYSVNTRIIWVFFPAYNRSIAITYDSPLARKVLYINSIFSNTVLSSLAIIIVSITTSIMVHKLIEFKKWRQANAGGAKKEADGGKKPLASKDIEVIKSVTTVTGIFLICLSMSHFPASAVVAIPGVSFSGINRNIYFLVYMFRFLFDAINSSINFFFYIKISSRYKAAFSTAFPRCAVVDEEGRPTN